MISSYKSYRSYPFTLLILIIFSIINIEIISTQLINTINSSSSKCPLYCKSCSPHDSQYCQLCQENYSLTKNRSSCVLSTIQNCQYYSLSNSNTYNCYLCFSSYILIQTPLKQQNKNQIKSKLEDNKNSNYINQQIIKQSCILDDTGCVQRKLITQVCSKCAYGTQLALGSCQGVLHCKTYQNSYCVQCQNGYNIQNNKCVVNINNPISGCLQISLSHQYCQICKQNYSKIGFLCIPKNKIIKYCSAYNYSYSCLICKNELEIYQNQCLTQTQITQKIVQKIKSNTIANTKSTQMLNINQINYVQYTYSIQNDNNNIKNDNSIIQNKTQITQSSQKQVIVRGLNFQSSSSNFLSGCFYKKDQICLKCLKQYKLVGGYCIIENCLKIENDQCVQCKTGYQLLKDTNKCKQKIQEINLNLFPNNRVVSNHQQINKYAQNCKLFNLKGQCTKCNDGYFMKTGTCFINSNCRTLSNTNGLCLTCFSAYSLINGECIQIQKDPNCKRFLNNKCQQCVDRFYLEFGSAKCVPVNIKCNEYHIFTGKCLSCYEGYILSSGQCLVDSIQPSKQIQKQNQNKTFKTTKETLNLIKDVNCKTLDQQNKFCKQCYQGYFLKKDQKSQKCTQLDPQCKTHNLLNGQCLTCFDGYKVNQGKCVLGQLSNQANQQLLKTNNKQQLQNKPNLTDNIQQKTKDTKISSVSENKIIQNCRSIKDNKCVQCSFGFYLQSQNCIEIDPSCKTYDYQLKKCKQCYDGYIVDSQSKDQKCTIKTKINNNPFCETYNSQTNKCTKCIKRYYLNSDVKNRQQECISVSIICDQYDQNTGRCKSCIEGYVFQNEQCIRPNLGVDLSCEYYQGGYCVRCKQYYEIKDFKCSLKDSINQTYYNKVLPAQKNLSFNNDILRQQLIQENIPQKNAKQNKINLQTQNNKKLTENVQNSQKNLQNLNNEYLNKLK